jgi:hypothetical protein
MFSVLLHCDPSHPVVAEAGSRTTLRGTAPVTSCPGVWTSGNVISLILRVVHILLGVIGNAGWSNLPTGRSYDSWC